MCLPLFSSSLFFSCALPWLLPLLFLLCRLLLSTKRISLDAASSLVWIDPLISIARCPTRAMWAALWSSKALFHTERRCAQPLLIFLDNTHKCCLRKWNKLAATWPTKFFTLWWCCWLIQAISEPVKIRARVCSAFWGNIKFFMTFSNLNSTQRR